METQANQTGTVIAVCKKAQPGLPKYAVERITIIAKHGVEGDYHAGAFIRHRWMAKQNPSQPNHRQLLLTDTGIYAFLAEKDIHLEYGQLGENIVLDGVDVMALKIGTVVAIGDARLEVTEIRRPCYQLNEMHPHLEDTVMPDKNDPATWNAGVMAVAAQGGVLQPGDPVQVLD